MSAQSRQVQRATAAQPPAPKPPIDLKIARGEIYELAGVKWACVQLTWVPMPRRGSKPIVAHQVRCNKGPLGACTETYPGMTASALVHGLPVGVQIVFNIRTVDQDGQSDWSPPLIVTLPTE